MTKRTAPAIFYQLMLTFDEPPNQIIPRGRRSGRQMPNVSDTAAAAISKNLTKQHGTPRGRDRKEPPS